MKSLSVKLGVILIGSLIFLVSCSSGGKWVKPDSGESEFEKDYNECERNARRECIDTEWVGYFLQKNCINKLTKDCLNYRGWEYQKP